MLGSWEFGVEVLNPATGASISSAKKNVGIDASVISINLSQRPLFHISGLTCTSTSFPSETRKY